MKCGIVILNYNTYDLTCGLVKQCLKMNSLDKIVIVDNCSNDDFCDFCKEINSNKVKFIKNDVNLGYAAGNNMGLKYLKKENFDYAFIANPDVWFDEDVIISILDVLSKNLNCGVASCTRMLNGTKETGQYWWIPSYTSALFESLCIGRKIQNKKCINITGKKSADFKGEFMEVEVVGGAFFGCNLKIMDEINYFDENTFLWYEENILAYKLRMKEYKVFLLNICTYQHNHVKKKKGNKRFNVFLNSKRYYCYNYLKINKLQKILLYIFDLVGMFEQKIINYLR